MKPRSSAQHTEVIRITGAAEETRTPDPIITNCKLDLLDRVALGRLNLANILQKKHFLNQWCWTGFDGVCCALTPLPY